MVAGFPRTGTTWIAQVLSRAEGVAWPPAPADGADRVMVKAVHAPLALEWIWARLGPRIVVVLRHPLNVIASWLELGWGGCALETNPWVRERFVDRWNLPMLDPDASRLQRLAWEAGLFTSALRAGVERHSEWIAASHEDL